MGIARKLEEVDRAMNKMKTRNDLGDFLNDPENAQRFDGLVEDVRYALIDYQASTPETLTLIMSNIRLRLHCSETSMTKAVKL